MEREKIQLLAIASSVVFLTIMVFLVLLFFYFQKRKTHYLIEKMESELHFQSELVKTQIEIKDQTLSEISRELHDNIGQILSVAIMQVNLYSHNEDKKPNKKDWQELKSTLSKSLDEIRMLSKIINRDNTTKLDFVEAIRLDFDRIKKLKGIDCKLTIQGEIPEIDPSHELIIYRILQESVHNILRHSQSEVIRMEVIASAESLNILMADQGIGFTVNNAKEGLGLRNMRSRSKLIGAQLDIASGNHGTTLRLAYKPSQEHDS